MDAERTVSGEAPRQQTALYQPEDVVKPAMKALNIRGSLIPGRLKLLLKEQDIFRKSSVRKCHVLIPLHKITSWYLLHETRVIAVQSPVPFQTEKKAEANQICHYHTNSKHVTTSD